MKNLGLARLQLEIAGAGHDVERRLAEGDRDLDNGDLWAVFVDREIVTKGGSHEELERQLREWWNA